MKLLQSLLILASFVAVPGIAAQEMAEVSLSFKPDDSAILLVDHQNLTVDWVKSLPRETMIANVRMLARLGAEMHIPLDICLMHTGESALRHAEGQQAAQINSQEVVAELTPAK